MLFPCHSSRNSLMFYHMFSESACFANGDQCLVINAFDGLREF